MKIDWSEPLTKGRQVYASVMGINSVRNINYEGGFLIGWDRWSDKHVEYYPINQGWMGGGYEY